MNSDYQKMKLIVQNIPAVNDPAERAILLAKMLQGKITRDPTERMKLFLSIPYAREKLKKITKSSILAFDVTS